MPTIFRFLRMLAILAAIAYAAMAALVWSVHPRQTDFSEPVKLPTSPAEGDSVKLGAQPPPAAAQ